MKIPTHLVEVQSQWQPEAFRLENGISCGNGLLADLADLLLDVLLVELDDGG